MIGEAVERNRPPMYLKEDRRFLNGSANYNFLVDRAHVIRESAKRNQDQRNRNPDQSYQMRRDQQRFMEHDEGEGEQSVGKNEYSPKYYHGERNQYRNDYTEYVREEMKRQQVKPNIHKAKNQLKDSQEYSKIGQGYPGPLALNLRNNKRQQGGDSVTTTQESGFPLLKDALVEEIVRTERKKKYAEELRNQMVENEQRKKQKLAQKITDNPEINKFYQNDQKNWYEYHPSEKQLAEQSRISSANQYMGVMNEQGPHSSNNRFQSKQNLQQSNNLRGENPNRKQYPGNQRNQGYEYHDIPEMSEEASMPEIDMQENFQKDRQAVFRSQQFGNQPRVRRQNDVFKNSSRNNLVMKYQERRQIDELKDETFFNQFGLDGKRRYNQEDEEENYVDQLKRQMDEAKEKKKSLRMKQRLEDLEAEEKYLTQLKKLEIEALEENERRLLEAAGVQEENLAAMQMRQMDQKAKVGTSLLVLTQQAKSQFGYDGQGEYSGNISAENENLIMMEQNGLASARKSRAERAGEPMARGLQAPSPEVPLDGQKRLWLNSGEETRELQEEESRLRDRVLTFKESQVEEQKRQLHMNNNILYQQLIDLRAQKVFSEDLKNKAFHDLDMVKSQVDNLRREQTLQLNKLKQDLFKDVDGTTQMLVMPFKYQENRRNLYARFGEQSQADANVDLGGKSEMVPIDLLENGFDAIDYYERLTEAQYRDQVNVDSRNPSPDKIKGKPAAISRNQSKKTGRETPLSDIKGKTYDQLVDILIDECRQIDKVKLGIKDDPIAFDSQTRRLDQLLANTKPKNRIDSAQDLSPTSIKTPRLLKDDYYDWEKEYENQKERKNSMKKLSALDQARKTFDKMNAPVYIPELSSTSYSPKNSPNGSVKLILDSKQRAKSPSLVSQSEGDPYQHVANDEIKHHDSKPKEPFSSHDKNNIGGESKQSSHSAFDPDAIFENFDKVPKGRLIEPQSLEHSQKDDKSEASEFDPDAMMEIGKSVPLGRLI